MYRCHAMNISIWLDGKFVYPVQVPGEHLYEYLGTSTSRIQYSTMYAKGRGERSSNDSDT